MVVVFYRKIKKNKRKSPQDFDYGTKMMTVSPAKIFSDIQCPLFYWTEKMTVQPVETEAAIYYLTLYGKLKKNHPTEIGYKFSRVDGLIFILYKNDKTLFEKKTKFNTI